MIVELETVLATPEYKDADPNTVKRKLLGVESAIRAYTNNNFIVRGARINCLSRDGLLWGTSRYIVEGDRINIVRSGMNDTDRDFIVRDDVNVGLYDVVSIDLERDVMTLDDCLFDADFNDVFLVKYPEAIKAGVLELMKWESTGRDKVGVSSETISRHSVSYYNFSDNEMLMGYPAALMGFLKPYIKARF